MTSTLTRVSVLLLAVAVLLVGHGLQLTLLPVYAQQLGWTPGSIGLTASTYYLGLVIGCFVGPRIVAQIGHIRTFAVMAAVATVALLGAGLLNSVPAWLVLRFVTGLALAGLYMVIESWLSEASPHDKRGAVLAVYTMVCLIAMSLGQGFMTLQSADSLQLFVIASLFLCLAIVPVGLTTTGVPQSVPRARFAPRALLQSSRVAVVCAFAGGMVTGAFWAVGPLVGRGFMLDAGDVGVMMSLAILGGALVQLPVGRLSDSTDRRFVIGGILLLGCTVALLGWRFSELGRVALFVVMSLIGATTLPIYALCVAHACDNAKASLIETTSGILVMNSLGSILGAMLVALLIERFGAAAFFLYAFVCLLLPAVWTFYRVSVVDRPHQHAHRFPGVPRTTQVAAALLSDPHDNDDAVSAAAATTAERRADGRGE